MTKLFFSILLATSFLPCTAEVYRIVDENGIVTFTDKLSDKAKQVELKVNKYQSSPGSTEVKNKLLITVTSQAKTRSIIRDLGTISFNNTKQYSLTGFLFSLQRYLEEYEGITLTFNFEDIPYALVDDYESVTLVKLLSDIDSKNRVKIKQTAKNIVIVKDW